MRGVSVRVGVWGVDSILIVVPSLPLLPLLSYAPLPHLYSYPHHNPTLDPVDSCEMIDGQEYTCVDMNVNPNWGE